MNVNVILIFVSSLIVGSLEFTIKNDKELNEGSQCFLENGNQGVCKKVTDCAPRLIEVTEGKRNSDSSGRCGFEDFIEIVCCPMNVTAKVTRRPAEIACQEYNDQEVINNLEQNDLSLHIFGGVEARTGEFPYVVALGYRNENFEDNAQSIVYSCGGSLISSQYVLTAAHCVNNINERVPIEVRVGHEDITSNATNVQRIPISDIISHPKFKRSTNYNDVAIIKLKSQVQVSDTAKPVCLQTKSVTAIEVTSRMSLVVIGWGATSFQFESSNRLMRTPSLSLVDREECSKLYNDTRKLPRGIDDSMICALDTNSSRRADACQGDSGGPLLMLTESGDTVIGITSFGQSCGSSIPGVYTAIYPFLDWIEEHVWSPETSNYKPQVLKTTVTKTFFTNISLILN